MWSEKGEIMSRPRQTRSLGNSLQNVGLRAWSETQLHPFETFSPKVGVTRATQPGTGHSRRPGAQRGQHTVRTQKSFCFSILGCQSLTWLRHFPPVSPFLHLYNGNDYMLITAKAWRSSLKGLHILTFSEVILWISVSQLSKLYHRHFFPQIKNLFLPKKLPYCKTLKNKILWTKNHFSKYY